MAKIVTPGAGILYMKVGTHAQETLDDIITRKTKEIEEAGVAFWGYGGNTCHPQNMVQPFAKDFEERGQTVILCMHPMDSKHFAYPLRADEYSIDGIKWEIIPAAIRVLGSRYALVIKNLRKDDFDLPLNLTRVALGNSMGTRGSQYIKGRVDKACLQIVGEAASAHPEVVPEEETGEAKHIGLVAELASPYAVYVRNVVK
ncbi:MAG TPA: hypothetical protein VGG72_20830 [Bryobacteraceae bacterium]|jgi:hypothetical protein